MQQAWALPLVPWTDLNNTVVLGSFLIGVVALLPIFCLTLPFFRFFKPDEESEERAKEASERVERAKARAVKKESSFSDPKIEPAAPSVQPAFASASTQDIAKEQDDLSENLIIDDDKESVKFEETTDEVAGGENKHSVVLVHGPHENSQPPRFAGPVKASNLETIPFDTVDFFDDDSSEESEEQTVSGVEGNDEDEKTCVR